MSTSRASALSGELALSLRDLAGVRAVYLFGSALDSEAPEDVDLVVVYEAPLTPISAPQVRDPIESAVATTLGLPAHLMFLTEREATEFRDTTTFAPVFSTD